ncbi:MAG: hypothetical protein AAFO06_13980 [Cyanobacteria bacterium J06597_16]
MPANSRTLLRWADYAAVSASLVGAIAVISTGRPIYAIAPLSVSAGLSLISRQQQQQYWAQTLDKTHRQATEQLEDVKQVNTTLRKQLEVLSVSLERKTFDLKQIIAQNATTTASAQQLQSFIQIASNRFKALEKTTQSLHLAVKSADNQSDSWASQVQVQQLTTELEELRSQISTLADATTIDEISQQLQQLSTQLNTLDQEQWSPLTEKATQLENSIVSLSDDMSAIHTRLETLNLPTSNSDLSDLDLSDLETLDSLPMEAASQRPRTSATQYLRASDID